MANLDYLFAPYYGFEPFDATTGGAKFTGHNLVVTMWQVNYVGDEGNPVDFLSLVQPASENDNISPTKRAGQGLQAMNSRVSASGLITPDTVKLGLADSMLFVCNPPGDLKSQLANSVIFNGGDPTDIDNYTVFKSLNGCYSWRGMAWTDGLAANTWFLDIINATAVFAGDYIPLGDYVGANGVPMPLLKTNGADGQAPEFFDRTTEQGVNEMLQAVNAGDFYVPIMLNAEFNNGIVFQIVWPHSTARG